jgi:hypothetical protein
MRLGKEQSAGFVTDVESEVPGQVEAPATVVAAESRPAPEPVAVAH